MRRRLLNIALVFLLFSTMCRAFEPTHMSTLYYGPNAFPVPEQMNGRVDSLLSISAMADGYWDNGYRGEGKTFDVVGDVRIPLFTRYAQLHVWMPIQEWYDYPQKGNGAGDVYVSTDIQVLTGQWFSTPRAARCMPDAAVRVLIKTASGGQAELFRHFDDPGYMVDLSLGKSFYFGGADKRAIELRLSGDVGFLCWQTTTSRQNDAPYYGLQMQIKHRYVGAMFAWQGYSGWENDGDKPMTISARVNGRIALDKRSQTIEPFVQYQYGIRDYPFHQIRVGMTYRIGILKQ